MFQNMYVINVPMEQRMKKVTMQVEQILHVIQRYVG